MECLEEDASVAGVDDYKRPANKLVHCFLESSVSAFVSSGGSINFSRGGTVIDA